MDNLTSITVNADADSAMVTASISLPAAVWERLTADRRPDAPDPDPLPLNERIAGFLDSELSGWLTEADAFARYGPSVFDPGIDDDDVPF